MVRIPYIKIPSVRVGSIVPTSNIGTGGATPVPPTPITYLTQWKIVGNSEVHTLPYPDGIVLPNGYKRCKYIETRGTGYINLGYNTLYSYEVKAVAQSIGNSNGILIHNGEFAAQYFGCSKDGYWTVGGTTGISDVISTEPTIINLSFTNNEIEFTINGVSISRQGTSRTSNFYLFSNDANKYQINGKVWYLKAFDGDTLVHHWIPCLDTNDVPCMYDVVIKQPYYNSGPGMLYYKLYPQPTEIWSCGDYSDVDGKYHILVKPQGGSIADIALDKPLRKVNDVADTIEFTSGTEGKALVTRNIISHFIGDCEILTQFTNTSGVYRWVIATDAKKIPSSTSVIHNILNTKFNVVAAGQTYNCIDGVSIDSVGTVIIYTSEFTNIKDANTFKEANADVEVMYEAEVLTTELVDAPQIAEAESYTCEISQGGKAVSWSSFETYSE